MNELELYQNYWWFLISVLGAALVFMLFVLGGQTMLRQHNSETDRQLMVNALGRKWELTFTSLVVFGGAFFASFPLFYSTSFGGAYWLWMAILLSFVVQAVGYEFRRKRGNLYGTLTYDTMLLLNGVAGCVLLGAAVGMFFFGGPFTVVRANLTSGLNPVICNWAPTHGLEVMADWRCLLLGLTVFFLARTLGAMYFVNNIRTEASFTGRMRREAFINGLVFAILYVAFLLVLLTSDGVRNPEPGKWSVEPHLYWTNFTTMWWWGILLLLGTLAVVYAIVITRFGTSRRGIWWAGAGTAAVIVSLFAAAGFGHTAYLPSALDIESSLTVANSSSTLFTLKVMSSVSLLIPVVVAYIWAVWRKMNAGGITESDIAPGSHQY